MTLSALGQSVPTFWFGILLILLFSVQLHLLPSFGFGELRHLILPSITLSGYLTARLARLTRASMLDALALDCITVAKSKGLSRSKVILRHALPNALIPVVSLLGVELAHLLGGAVITETIFAWPGVGRQLVEAVLQRDYAVVQTVVIMITIFVSVIMLLSDVAYAILDPRIRFG
jgi:peptide/nickel transport system permease protein